ncbi:MAG: molybdopterin-binding protein, partial [Spirochaetota bacterium]
MNRKIYLKMKSTQETKELLNRAPVPSLPTLELPVEEALGYILQDNVKARISVPHYNASAMDGISLNAGISFGASESRPVTITPEQYKQVNTGDPVEYPHNSVVPAEELSFTEHGEVILYKPSLPWKNIRTAGEDMAKGELIAPMNTVIDEKTIPLLLAGGITAVPVKQKPRALVIPTGSEIVPHPVPELKPGQIVDYNSSMICSMLKKWGCVCTVSRPVGDNRLRIVDALKAGIAEYELVVVIAGSSAGSKDYTMEAVQSLGEVKVHGVKMMPGKPFLFGLAGDRAVFGIPGFPASAYFSMIELVKTYLERLLGAAIPRASISCSIANDIPSRAGFDEYIRVAAAEIEGCPMAVPLKRGAGVLKSVREASGY